MAVTPTLVGVQHLLPLPIAWISIEDEGQVWESATCFYNGASDGGRPAPGQRQQPYLSSLLVGLPTGPFHDRFRRASRCVVHVVTEQHGGHVASLLKSPSEGQPLDPALKTSAFSEVEGLNSLRISDVPVAFSCSTIREFQAPGDGVTGFFLNIEAIFISGSVIIDGKVDPQRLRTLASLNFEGSSLLRAIEEYTMYFPTKKDSEGLWIIPECIPAEPLVKNSDESKDVVYRCPVLPDLPYNPFKALVTPRPIGWISTTGPDGDNLSPYSFFGYISPRLVYFSVGGGHVEQGEKDALRDAKASGAFCVNLVPWRLRMAMSASAASASRKTDEFELPVSPESPGSIDAMPEKGRCEKINAPCVTNAGLRLECELMEVVQLSDGQNVVVGHIVHTVGAVDGPVATRCGYMNYFRIGDEHILDPQAQMISE
mmetsp:Transcript_36454/g.77528  ORF Transcript_36454/g.77528 Transcript_36454/m.77528 type:complete len:428 (+) Transcript_36454:118-1401(+)|eukprot:CAMPEP_0206482046 /NCGR_PEP_ID=MMETSP0324_2-20121206/38599_1 /ASSEMBLY_ACC=CAM_ASM_000836 /TAXON_ID=2866 /ORGANISM="Crypthecodinium cohnii, Strain Seligo" /LENGTH=427 /DNA_ID=CAMNT_0053959835 /DNA_START=108 /DNA_END=1391 /DNA_ORIENTATION=+